MTTGPIWGNIERPSLGKQIGKVIAYYRVTLRTTQLLKCQVLYLGTVSLSDYLPLWFLGKLSLVTISSSLHPVDYLCRRHHRGQRVIPGPSLPPERLPPSTGNK